MRTIAIAMGVALYGSSAGCGPAETCIDDAICGAHETDDDTDVQDPPI